MTTRRDFMSQAALSATALALMPLGACSQETPALTASGGPMAPAQAPSGFSGTLMQRAIPASGEPIPVIGMGTSGSFEVGAGDAARNPLREVLRRFVAAGGSVIDTAPTYGSAEDVLGDLIAEAGVRDKLFIATKLSRVSGREQGMAQFQASLRRLQTDRVELLQVHNLRDTDTQLAVARELKQQGKVKYVGLTHYVERAHEDMAAAMQKHKPDFVQINYSPVSRGVEQRILPLAQELGIAIMANRTYEDGDLFSLVKSKPVPEWAAEVGADSWAQLFLRFVLSHPAVTVVIPATSKPKNQTDNLKAGVEGKPLDDEQRAALIAALA